MNGELGSMILSRIYVRTRNLRTQVAQESLKAEMQISACLVEKIQRAPWTLDRKRA